MHDSNVIYYPKSYFEALSLEELFPVAQPLEVELGSGDGSFLVQYACANPNVNFFGVERLLGRLRKIERKSRRAQIRNLRAMRIEAGYFLEYLLPAHCVHALHVYFPDPWPKRKHLKNRLINERFTVLAARVLESQGTVYLRTDDANYFAQMGTVFHASPEFRETSTPDGLTSFLTDFEREFQARGIETLRIAFQRTS